MIKQWINIYKPKTIEETEQVLREIMQELALAGLYRAGFFKYAAFYGGTALRIFHGLDRFSEDLDFSLIYKDVDFQLGPYIAAVIEEFAAVGMNVSYTQKEKKTRTAIDSAFLKSDTLWGELVFENAIPQIDLSSKPKIKIKLEIDTNPPLGFQTENRLLTRPFSFYVNCLLLPDLFAGKMHALLFRKWKNRVKGRDWYDLEWYLKNETAINLEHFRQRAVESGDWSLSTMSQKELSDLLLQKIHEVDFGEVKKDIIRFIPHPQLLEIWSPAYFLELSRKLRFT